MTQLEIKLDIQKGQDKRYLFHELEKHLEEFLSALQDQLKLEPLDVCWKSLSEDQLEIQNDNTRIRSYQKITLRPTV